MRKCRNWQTSKTKDLVINAIVWVQVPSSAVGKSLGIKGFFLFHKKVASVYKGTIRSKPRNFGDFLCYPHSAYVQYASIVCLEKPRNSCGWSLRVGKAKILAPFRHLNDAYRDVRGVKVTKKGLKSTLHRPCCPLYTDANHSGNQKET